MSSSRTRPARRPRLALLSLLAAALASAPAQASAQPPAEHENYVPGEVIVRYHAGTGQAARSRVESRTGTDSEGELPGGSRKLGIEDGESVQETVLELRRDPRVAYAVPNHVAQASSVTPNDPGFGLQWNFWGPAGINMPEAWSLASGRGAPGGRGAVVAVLDTGVAYRRLGPFRRAPDLRLFVRGYDFIQNDRYPVDLNGHGTHVAGTIAAATNNGLGTAGIAYGSRIMPVRTLDAHGGGDAVTITRGIRYAVRHHADVINLSLEFGPHVRAADIPDLLAAIRYARRHRVVLTGVAGNEGASSLPYPRPCEGRDSGCRHNRGWLPGQLLERRRGRRRRGAGRRSRRHSCRRRLGPGAMPPRGPAALHLPTDLHLEPGSIWAAVRVLRNVNGRAPCSRGGGPSNRVKAAWIAAEPRRRGTTNRTDGPRPRPTRLRCALRARPDRRGRRAALSWSGARAAATGGGVTR